MVVVHATRRGCAQFGVETNCSVRCGDLRHQLVNLYNEGQRLLHLCRVIEDELLCASCGAPAALKFLKRSLSEAKLLLPEVGPWIALETRDSERLCREASNLTLD